jgi:hypothetical protein
MKIKDREQNDPSVTVGLVDLDVANSAVRSSLRSPGSRRCYEHAIAEFICWYCSEPRLGFNKAVVSRYRMHLESRGLAPGTINLRLAAIRRLSYEAADCGLLSPEPAAGIQRVKGAKKLGVRVGNWLLANEARDSCKGGLCRARDTRGLSGSIREAHGPLSLGMSRLSSRPHDRGQSSASSSLFTNHPKHFMSNRKRIQIALTTSSTLSSQRSVASCRSERPADRQASRILPHKFPQKTSNCNPACSSPHLPTRLCPLRRTPLIKQNP